MGAPFLVNAVTAAGGAALAEGTAETVQVLAGTRRVAIKVDNSGGTAARTVTVRNRTSNDGADLTETLSLPAVAAGAIKTFIVGDGTPAGAAGATNDTLPFVYPLLTGVLRLASAAGGTGALTVSVYALPEP